MREALDKPDELWHSPRHAPHCPARHATARGPAARRQRSVSNAPLGPTLFVLTPRDLLVARPPSARRSPYPTYDARGLRRGRRPYLRLLRRRRRRDREHDGASGVGAPLRRGGWGRGPIRG